VLVKPQALVMRDGTQTTPESPPPLSKPPTEPELTDSTNRVKIKKLTNHESGAFGERTAHDKMVQKGYEPVGDTDGVYHPGKTDIDGVYKKPQSIARLHHHGGEVWVVETEKRTGEWYQSDG
jgi:hypothetical protein